MATFRKLTLDDIPIFRPFMECYTHHICDYSIGGIFMWRDFFATEYAIINDTLVVANHGQDGVRIFNRPVGKDFDGAVRFIKQYCREHDTPMIFCTATQEDVEDYKKLGKLAIKEEEIWADYLYNVNDLRNFSGSHYQGQRNHINAFLNAHPGWNFSEINSKNLQLVKHFFNNYDHSTHKDSPFFAEEERKVLEVLENMDKYGFAGGLLCLEDGTPAAFSLGEVVGDTLYVHIEKADRNVRGAYQMVVREFARRFASPQVVYINREEDVGDPGLRFSKQSYHPCCLIRKYTVRVDPHE